jgi:hypothetical protein
MMHGAGATNLMFMREGSILMEIFPYHFELEIYQFLANKFGISYRSFVNEELGDVEFVGDKASLCRYKAEHVWKHEVGDSTYVFFVVNGCVTDILCSDVEGWILVLTACFFRQT